MSQTAIAKNSFSNRILIFAHYDKDKIVDDYVIYYLQKLNNFVDKIIFVSANDLTEEEKSKLKEIVDVILAKKHGEYDFGSYKRGFLNAVENSLLENVEECIFANDSCFGPFSPIEEVFEKMSSQKCDFWSMTRNKIGFVEKNKKFVVTVRPHFQSYFLVFKKPVFSSEKFLNFIKAVKKEKSRRAVITNYEIGLTEVLQEAGFVGKSYVKAYENSYNPVLYEWKNLLLKQKFPFLKTSLPRLDNLKCTVVSDYEEIIKKISNYPIELIKNNVKRVSKNKDFLNFVPALIRPFLYKIIFYVKNKISKSFSEKAEGFSEKKLW